MKLKYISVSIIFLAIKSLNLHIDQLQTRPTVNMASKPTIIYGTAGVVVMSKEVLDGMLSTLKTHNVKNIDTAFIYVWHPQIQWPDTVANICDSRPAKRSSERPVRQRNSTSTQKRLASAMGHWESRMSSMD